MVQMLEKLRAAGVATHSAVARSPDRLAERDFLDALLSVTAGNLFRVGPYSYAFDIAGATPAPPSAGPFAGGAAAPGPEPAAGEAERIRAALERQFGSGAVELAEIPDDRARLGDGLPETGLLLVEAMAGATETALRREAPACRAVIDAEFALAAARAAAEGIDALVSESTRTGPLAHRLGAIEERLAAVAERTEMMASQPVALPGLDRLLDRLARIESGVNALFEREQAPAGSGPAAPSEAMAERLDRLGFQIGEIAERVSAVLPDPLASGERMADAVDPVVARLEAQIADLEAVSSRLDASLTESRFQTD